MPEVVRVDPDQRDESVAFAVAGVGLDEEARRGLVAVAPVVALDLGVARDPVHLASERVVGGHALEAERVRQLVHEGEHGRRRRMPGARPDHIEELGKQAIARRVHQRAEVVDAPPGVAQQVRQAELEAEARVGIATPVSAHRTGLGTKDGARLAGQFTLEDVQREVADDLACVVAVHVDPGLLGLGLDHVLRERVAADAVEDLAMDLVERIDEPLPRGGVELARDDDVGPGDLRHGCRARCGRTNRIAGNRRRPAGRMRGGWGERFCPTATRADHRGAVGGSTARGSLTEPLIGGDVERWLAPGAVAVLRRAGIRRLAAAVGASIDRRAPSRLAQARVGNGSARF